MQLPVSKSVLTVLAIGAGVCTVVQANDYGSNTPYALPVSAQPDHATVANMVFQAKHGTLAAVGNSIVYNIGTQVNCTLAPVASGNSSSQNGALNSPNINGQTGNASGNTSTSQSSTVTASDTGTQPLNSPSTSQTNSGTVASNVSGTTTVTNGTGTATNQQSATQSNTAQVTAQVNNSTACSGVTTR